MADSDLKKMVVVLNDRFAPGKALQKTVLIQKTSKVFSPDKSLEEAYRALNVLPSGARRRRIFVQIVDTLKDAPSDVPGVSGHDRLMAALQKNLESSRPLPVRFALSDAFSVRHQESVLGGDRQFMLASLGPLPGKHDVSGPRGTSSGTQQSSSGKEKKS